MAENPLIREYMRKKGGGVELLGLTDGYADA